MLKNGINNKNMFNLLANTPTAGGSKAKGLGVDALKKSMAMGAN